MEQVKITFATGNQGKVFTFQNHLRNHGLDVAVVQHPVDVIEPQADTVEEVVRMKASQAHEQLQRPLLVDDSSFHIDALNGFPGPYAKYMVETVGAEGIVQLLQDRESRRAYFKCALVYVDEVGVFHEFSSLDVEGEILPYVDAADHPEAMGELWKIFVPDGWDKPLSRMERREHSKRRREQKPSNSPYEQFCQWLKQQDS